MAREKRTVKQLDNRWMVWTRFKLPLDVDLPSLIESDSHKNVWWEGIKSMSSFEGFLASQCGRMYENPNEVLFVSFWMSKQSFHIFKTSASYQLYLNSFRLQDENVQPPLEISYSFPFSTLNRAVTFTTIAFRHPLKAEDLESFKHLLNGIRIHPMISLSRLEMRHFRLWAEGVQNLGHEDTQVKTAIHCQPWKSKEIYQRVAQEDPESLESWKKRLDALGAVAFEVATWNFGRSLENDQSNENDGFLAL